MCVGLEHLRGPGCLSSECPVLVCAGSRRVQPFCVRVHGSEVHQSVDHPRHEVRSAELVGFASSASRACEEDGLQ